MALARWAATVQDAAGNAMAGCEIEVRNERTGQLVQVYSDRDGTVALGNPFMAAQATFGFHAPGGAYRVTARKGALQVVWRYVAIGTLGEYDLDEIAINLEAGLYPAETYADLSAYMPGEGQAIAGIVLNDPDPTLNGYYLWDATAEQWERKRGLPDTMARLTVVGGTPNAAEAIAGPGVDPGEVQVFYITPDEPNTGPVTISVNGGSPVPAKNYSGDDFPAGAFSGRLFLSREHDGSLRSLMPADLVASAAQSVSAAEEWAQSDDPISVEAGGDGSTDRSAKYWAGQAGEIAVPDGSITAAKITNNPVEQEAIRGKLGINDQPSGELFKTVSLMLADDNSVVGYEGSGAEVEVVAGDIIVAEGFRYKIAASDADAFDPDTATDGFHIETLGGVKLVYLADGLPAVEALTGARYPDNMADGLVLAVRIFNGARFISELVNVEGATFSFQIRDLRIDASGTQIENLSETGAHCLIFEQMVNRFNIEIKRMVGGPSAGSNLKIGGATTGDLFGNGVLTIIDNETQNPAAHLVEFTESSDSIGSCGRMTNVRLVGNSWRQPQNATVSAFYKDSAYGTLNNVRFSIMQHFCATNHPFYLILSRSAGGDYSHLVWDDMGVEYCLGGAIHLSGCIEARVGHVVSYDTNHETDGVLRKDTLWFGTYNEYKARFTDYPSKGSGTRTCHGVRSFGLARYGASSLPGSAPHSVVDVRFEDCREWFIESVGAATSVRNVRIACGNFPGTLIHLYNVTLQGYDAAKHLKLTP